MATCSHLDAIELTDVPAQVDGCAGCLASGERWVALRMCMSCGHIGCCDSSTGRHAAAHHKDTGHPIIRSAEPGQDWRWCYLDELTFNPPAA